MTLMRSPVAGARVAADLVGPALCLIDLNAGPDPDALYGLMRAETVSRIGHPRGIFTGRVCGTLLCGHGRICKIPLRIRLTKQRRWLGCRDACVWMWIPSRAVGIVQSRSDRFGSGPVRMAACDRLLHRHAFVRDRP